MLTASIVAYETKIEILKQAMRSFLDTDIKVKLYIIDNSPTNRLENVCKDQRISYIFNNKNLGFGSSHNIAIRQSMKKSKYHLLMNPDIFFKEGTLEKLYNFMEDNQNIGLLMPKICYFDGSIQYLCKLIPGPFDLLLRRSNIAILKRIFRTRLESYEFKNIGYNKIMEVPYLSGCFMFIRNEVFEKIGIFDERFFMYLEDVDLSRRIHQCYKTIYYPEAVVYHKHEKGSYKDFRLLKYHVVSAIRYFNKWGWLFDRERKEINHKVLKNLECMQGS